MTAFSQCSLFDAGVPHFGGRTFDAALDGARLGKQMYAVLRYMGDFEWHFTPEVAKGIGAPVDSIPSIGARIRDCRKPHWRKRLGFTSESERVGGGLWRHRLVAL